VKGNRMNRFALLSLFAFGAVAMSAPVPKELKVQPDVERMRGAWKVDNGGSYWVFQGEKLFAGGTATPQENGYNYAIALRPGRNGGEFDLTGGSTFAGIYKFVGDDLIVCYAGGTVRPTDFDQGPNRHIHILKRLPEGKK